jgi:1-deoxy-D-xylulose-5-phosphate reductoisomerase
LTYPDRVQYPNETLNYGQEMNLDFHPVDYDKFPCIRLAVEAGREGGCAPAILNAANEIAVERFLKREIRYIDIPKIIETSLNKIITDKELSPEALLNIDKETRQYARSLNI